MPSLVIAESSLEIIPKNLRNHPSVVSHSKKIGKNPSEILLDNSWHFAAMKGIKNEIKRGRPDIIHMCLQNICSTPLYRQKKITIYIHTINDQVIFLGDDVRLPKSYHRFSGLIEKLFLDKSIEYDGKKLLELESMNFPELIEEINPSTVVGFSTEGKQSSIEEIAKKLSDETCLVIGGFQKGHFSEDIKNNINEFYKIAHLSLEAHVIASRIIYEYEKTIFM